MILSSVYIVLCNPDESRNIGSCCRAMKNMGITHLRIVGNKESYDDMQVRTLSVHAADIWEQTLFYTSIQEATADCALVAGTTRRRGKTRKAFAMTPEQFAEHLMEGTYNAPIAVVFGNERTGLTTEELQSCMLAVSIPSSEDFPSLNLSHAVQIITYTLFRFTQKRSYGYTPLTITQIDEGTECILEKLQHIGFFNLGGKEDMRTFWRSFIARASLSESEKQYLEKVFNKIEGLYIKRQ